MTRINLVPPQELMDQHLFAEFREIKMIPKALRRSIAAFGVDGVRRRIPREFTLNTGHVCFFYDKGYYLHKRYSEIRAELDRRGINYNKDSQLDPDGVFGGILCPPLNEDYTPTPEALAIIRRRIAEKIALKPWWYRYEGRKIANDIEAGIK